MTITKQHLADYLWKDYNLTEKEMLKLVQKALDFISAALANGNKVEIRNFGMFEVRVAPAHLAINPKKPTIKIPMPAKCIVKFIPGKEMREGVRKLTPDKIKRARSKKK